MSNTDSQIHRRGFMFVLSSPSGAGKTTISRLLLDNDDNLEMSISVTTREKRPNEVDGKDYVFVRQEDFSELSANNELLECAEVFGNSYGTPEAKVDALLNQGTDVLFDIDWQGTQQLAKSRRADLVSIFILPPSMAELEKRLRGRAQDSEEVIAGRMSKAANEISHWLAYDYVMVNNDVEESLEQVKAILHAERQKRVRQSGLKAFVDEMLGA
jgi:guanylate kinase